MKYIKQLSTYTDFQTQISVQFPWRGLWHFTMFCKEIIYFIEGPPTMKDIFLLWDISAFFPSLFFCLKNSDFSTVIPFSDEITKLRTPLIKSYSLGLRIILRTRAIVNRRVEKTIKFSVCIPMLQLSALTLSRNWLESPLFCLECWEAPLYFYFHLGSVSSTTPKK